MNRFHSHFWLLFDHFQVNYVSIRSLPKSRLFNDVQYVRLHFDSILFHFYGFFLSSTSAEEDEDEEYFRYVSFGRVVQRRDGWMDGAFAYTFAFWALQISYLLLIKTVVFHLLYRRKTEMYIFLCFYVHHKILWPFQSCWWLEFRK